MRKDIVRLGVVGLGRGLDVVKTVVGESGVKLVAICDKNPKKIQNAVKVLTEMHVDELQTFDNYDDMLMTDIDAVMVATDAVCHVPFVVKALNSGKHVLSEIPAINSVEEAKLLKTAVKSHPDLKYMAGENCCYWAFIQMWKKMYEDGKFGQVVYAEGEYLHSEDYRTCEPYPVENHWRSYNPAIKYLTHNLGPLLYILDDQCVSVTCMESDVKYSPYKSGPQNAVALFRTKKGTIIKILISFGAYVGFDHNFRLIGTKGTIATDLVKPLDDAHSFAQLSDIPGSIDGKIEIPIGLQFPGESAAGGHGGADKKMIMDFISCILNDTAVPIDVDRGIRMSLPGIIAHESAVKGSIPLDIIDIT